MSESDLSFNIDIVGSGPPLVLIHGWGMHSGFFQSIIEKLKDKHTFYCVDLPGHGNSYDSLDLADLDTVVHYLVSALQGLTKDKLAVLGWSMGGLISQRIAMLYADLISKLILVSTTACFENKADWFYGIEPEVLTMFSAELEKDYSATLDRFLALQFMGSDQQKQNLRAARDLLSTKPEPTISTLRRGLQLLVNIDLRSTLDEIKCPCLILGGERDKLVPTKALRFMAETLPVARCYIIKGSSHAPFLTHSEIFNSRLDHFLL